MTGWTLDDIPWTRFDRDAIHPDLAAVIRTAALVEANAADYVAYLSGVFADDQDFLIEVARWGVEEEQHGAALGRWAELADPRFNFTRALADFRAGYQVPQGVAQSIRGSRTGELVARQVVETATSSFYSAVRDATDEPALKAIAGHIAADEFAHFRLFAVRFASYQAQTPLSFVRRIKVAATRFSEADDDELGWAWFAANVLPADPTATYRSGVYAKIYAARTLSLYRRPHVDNGVRMLLRAVALRPNGALFRCLSAFFWRLLKWRVAAAA
ncbi:MAG: hypothetical protein ACRYG4_12300 [Janthinobacterium lividum]